MQRVPSIFSRATARLCRSQPKRRYGGGKETSLKERDNMYMNTMDHFPKPSGSWQEGYRAKNRTFNIVLAVNAAVFTLTILEMEREGCFDLLFNPAYWSDRQVARQAQYYERGNKWRKKRAIDDDDDE